MGDGNLQGSQRIPLDDVVSHPTRPKASAAPYTGYNSQCHVQFESHRHPRSRCPIHSLWVS